MVPSVRGCPRRPLKGTLLGGLRLCCQDHLPVKPWEGAWLVDPWSIPAAVVRRTGVRLQRLVGRLQSPRASLFAKGREQAVPAGRGGGGGLRKRARSR